MDFADRLIAWAQRRDPFPLRMVTHEDHRLLLNRYCPLWPDEHHYCDMSGSLVRVCRPPWWRPFNIFLHKWQAAHRDEMHDHPRWSVTICLKGSLIEHTPWGSRKLTPGSIVVRSRKAIHAFELPDEGEETWTMFIVGRRNHRQNGFLVMPFGSKRPKIEWAKSDLDLSVIPPIQSEEADE